MRVHHARRLAAKEPGFDVHGMLGALAALVHRERRSPVPPRPPLRGAGCQPVRDSRTHTLRERTSSSEPVGDGQRSCPTQAASDVVIVAGIEPEDRATPPDARAQHRAFVLKHVINGGLTIEQAAAILTLSTRQVGRRLARSGDGPAGLAHGNRGRTPANRLDDVLRAPGRARDDVHDRRAGAGGLGAL